MADLAVYPDAEQLVIDALADLVASGHIGVTTPPDLADVLPFVRVRRHGGTDDRITETSSVDVDCLASGRGDAFMLARQIQQRLITGPLTVDHGTIDRARTLVAPNEVPWDESQAVRRFTASYSVSARR